MYFISFGIAAFASIIYHVIQKEIAPGANPVISLLITYVTAIVLTLPLFYLYPVRAGFGEAFRSINWASYALGFAIVGLEVGFLLAYRSGWSISIAAVGANVAAAVLLVPVGLWLYREQPSLINLAGILICIIGLIMINHQR